MIKIQYWNSCDLGDIYYAGGFVSEIILDTVLMKPEYEVRQVVNENENAEEVPELQVRIKKYRLEVLVPEYTADALNLIPLHDNIRVYTLDGLYSAEVRNVEVVINWEEFSENCLATAEIRFQQDDQVVDASCCTELPVATCLTPCLTVVGYLSDHQGSEVEGSYYIDDLDSQSIVQYQGGDFIETSCASSMVYSTDLGIDLYYDGDTWLQVPEIYAINSTGSGPYTVTVTGFALPNTWVQVEYSDDGVNFTVVPGYTLAAPFASTGVSFSLPANCTPWIIRVRCLNHNCDYGYSLEGQKQLGTPC